MYVFNTGLRQGGKTIKVIWCAVALTIIALVGCSPRSRAPAFDTKVLNEARSLRTVVNEHGQLQPMLSNDNVMIPADAGTRIPAQSERTEILKSLAYVTNEITLDKAVFLAMGRPTTPDIAAVYDKYVVFLQAQIEFYEYWTDTFQNRKWGRDQAGTYLYGVQRSEEQARSAFSSMLVKYFPMY